MKKLFTFFMAALMVMLAAGTNVAAADGANNNAGTGSITITNAKEGEIYKVYRIFDLESYSDGAYSYTLRKDDSKWNAFAGKNTELFKITDASYVSIVDETSAEAILNSALSYISENTIDADNSITAEEPEGEDKKVTISGLDLGYYLVTTTTGTICSLTTTKPTATVKDKNDVPTIDKNILEGDAELKENSASIGDTVDFKATINAKKGAKNYVFTDTLSEGLTLNKDTIKVILNESESALTNGTDYTLESKEHSFEITFKQGYLDEKLKSKNGTFTISYSATVNEKAIIGGGEEDGNTNKAYLSYGNDQKTAESITTTFVYSFNIFKYHTVKDENNTVTLNGLAGAEFKLYSQMPLGENDEANLIKLSGSDGKYIVNPKGANIFTSPESGNITIEGLKEGTYYIKEVKAPAGYNKLTTLETVTIDKDGNVKDKDGNTLENSTINIENKTGSILPETGGIGTTIFYVIGGLLMAGALVLLVTKKKMSSISK